MDASRFDQLSKVVAGATHRRSLIQAAAALIVAGLPALKGDEVDARRRGNRSVGAEHWNKKKRVYCLNGETIRRYRRKQEKLLAMGATLGKCSDVPPPCVPTTCEALGATCGTPPDGCGGSLQCGPCDDDPPPCTPSTCAMLGVACGTAEDGCGGMLSCGACGDGITCCSGACVDTNVDVNNCGRCGYVCPGGDPCSGGVCLD
jgi:hypothetical protein